MRRRACLLALLAACSDPAPGLRPLAVIDVAPVVERGASVVLDGSRSERAVAYRWTLAAVPAGSTAALSDSTAVAPTLVADLVGEYHVSLVVSDGSGESAPAAAVFVVGRSHYVRAAASGAATGESWDDAWTVLPDSLERGHTYYVAGGDYRAAPPRFDDPELGEVPIYIRKATAADHGAAAGWLEAYGDEAARFSTWEFVTSYYDVEGQSGGGPGSWTSGLGFSLQHSGGSVVVFHGPDDWGSDLPHDIRLAHAEIAGGLRELPLDATGTATRRTAAILWSMGLSGDAPGPARVTIERCYLHDAESMFLDTEGVRGWLVEYSYFARNHSDPQWHGEGWQAQGGEDVVFRYNIMEDVEGTAFLAIKKNSNRDHHDWRIHGNVFFNTGLVGVDGQPLALGGNGAIGISAGGTTNTSTTSGILVYNNTFYNIDGYNVGVYLVERGEGVAADNYAYNNLWVACGPVSHAGVTADFNDYYDTSLSSTPAGSERQLSGDPFLAAAAADFRLGAASAAGLATIGAEFGVDMLGAVRGGDGVWDRGALERGE